MTSEIHTRIILNRLFVALIFIITLYACSAGSAADSDSFHRLDKSNYIAGEYIISLAAGAGEKAIQTCFSEYGIITIKPLGNNAFLITLKRDPGLEELKKRSAECGTIKSIQPNYIYRMSGNTS
jgi:hypothetical protein